MWLFKSAKPKPELEASSDDGASSSSSAAPVPAPSKPNPGLFSEEKLAELLTSAFESLIEPAVNGCRYCDSTAVRRDRYLARNDGNVEKAVEDVLKTRSSWSEKVKTFAVKMIPIAGFPASLVRPVWHQLRTAFIIAALYGHDLQSSTVRATVLICVLDADLKKVPKMAVSSLIKSYAKTMAARIVGSVGGKLVGTLLPVSAVYDFFTSNNAKVGHSARRTFRPS